MCAALVCFFLGLEPTLEMRSSYGRASLRFAMTRNYLYYYFYGTVVSGTILINIRSCRHKQTSSTVSEMYAIHALSNCITSKNYISASNFLVSPILCEILRGINNRKYINFCKACVMCNQPNVEKDFP